MGRPNTAQLHYIEVMCESILYGAYCVLVVTIFWLLLQRRAMPMIHKVLFITGIVMWMLASVQLGLLIQQVTLVVTPIPNAQAQAAIATIQFMLGDMILIWRVWAVWGRRYRMIIVPFLLMLAAAGLRFVEADEIVTFAARPHVADVASALLVTNFLLSTLLIAGRIWYMQWKNNTVLGIEPPKTRNRYTGTLMLIIESGAIYALTQIIVLILDDRHSPGIHAVLDMQVPLAGILPTLIVLVVHFDLVPGTSATETYEAGAVLSRFAAASAQETASVSETGFGQHPETENRESVKMDKEKAVYKAEFLVRSTRESV